MSKVVHHPSLAQLEGRVARITGILDEMKAEDMVALDVRGIANFTDGFIIATARSSTHMRALVSKVEESLRDDGLRPINTPDRVGPETDTRWAVLDYGDVVVHLFTPEGRSYYDLEGLWGDAEPFAWQTLISA